MIVDALAHEALDGRIARVARVRCDGRADYDVRVNVPAEYAPPDADDATGLLPLCLLMAMRLGQSLTVDGRVEPDLLERVDAIQRLYRAMDPDLHAVELSIAGILEGTPAPGQRRGCCLSRGVDSLHAAALGRSPAGPIDVLVCADGIGPDHGETERAAEGTLTEQAAAALGKPLVWCRAPLWNMVDGVLDWDDCVAAGLAWIGHALSGELGHLVVPSDDSILTLGPHGTSPALEPLVGSGSLVLEHGEVALSRMGKVAWLAEHRPELLAVLRVCFDATAGAGNCGRCSKCIHTMACLRAAGALEQASLFPPELDVEEITSRRWPMLRDLSELDDIRVAAAAGGDGELAAAVQHAMRDAAGRGLLASWGASLGSFTDRHSNRVLSLAREGRAADEDHGGRAYPLRRIGLLRALDRRRGRHVYSAETWPAGEIVAELGALLPRGTGPVPLWMGEDGSVGTDSYLPPPAPLGLRVRARHALAPPRSRGCEEGILRRSRVALGARGRARSVGQVGSPLGCLHDEPGPYRIELWSGVHPVTGDQLLANSREEIEEARYVGAWLLGYLTADAPLTGRLGSWGTPIPWA